MAKLKRTFARSIRSNLRAPHMKKCGFRGKKGPESSPKLCHEHCHGISWPYLLRPRPLTQARSQPRKVIFIFWGYVLPREVATLARKDYTHELLLSEFISRKITFQLQENIWFGNEFPEIYISCIRLWLRELHGKFVWELFSGVENLTDPVERAFKTGIFWLIKVGVFPPVFSSQV